MKKMVFSLLLLMGLFSLKVHGTSLDQVKMAFIFNVVNYVNWPASSFQSIESPLTVCLHTEAHLKILLELTVQNETINNRPFKVVNLLNVDNLNRCHIIFISKSKYSKILPLFLTPILFMSDYQGFALQGGMIELQEQSQRLKLLINYNNVKKSGLSIRSNLLNLVTIVE